MQPLTLQGRKWGSVGSFVLTAPIALILIGLLIFHLIPRAEYGKASLVAAAAVFMLLQAAYSAVTAARPRRLILNSDGLALETPFRTRSWSWDQYVGLHGWWARALIVSEKPGRRRWVGIGHWQPDLGRAIAVYARRIGREVPPGSEEVETPSPLPFFILSGLLVAVALAVALSQ
jgi:hypothetical protein